MKKGPCWKGLCWNEKERRNWPEHLWLQYLLWEQSVDPGRGRPLAGQPGKLKGLQLKEKCSYPPNYSSGSGREIDNVDSFSSAVFRSKSILSKIHHPHSISKKRDTDFRGINHIQQGAAENKSIMASDGRFHFSTCSFLNVLWGFHPRSRTSAPNSS